MEYMNLQLQKWMYAIKLHKSSNAHPYSIMNLSDINSNPIDIDAFFHSEKRKAFNWRRLSNSEQTAMVKNMKKHNRLLMLRRMLIYSLSALIVMTVVLFFLINGENAFLPW